MFGADFWKVLRIIIVLAKALLGLKNGDLEELDQLSKAKANGDSNTA
jgi:hypothetical protein